MDIPFFGGLPALTRGDIMYGLAVTITAVFLFFKFTDEFFEVVILFVFWIAWAFAYNKNYTHRLLLAGYDFNDTENIVSNAKMALGVSILIERTKSSNSSMGNAKYCSQCGTEFTLHGKEYQSKRTCEYCEAPVKEDAKFCPSCGKEVAELILDPNI